MSNDVQVADPELAAMLNGIAEEPAAPPAPVERPAPVAQGSERPGMTPLIRDASVKRAALIAASEAIIRSIDGEHGLADVFIGMNRTLDGARIVLGSAFGTPRDTVERLMGPAIEEASANLYKAMRSGNAFKIDPFLSLETQVEAMAAAHKAWIEASQKAKHDVQAHVAASRPEPANPAIKAAITLPDTFSTARNSQENLRMAVRILEEEMRSMGVFAEAYEQALVNGDWTAIETWVKDHKGPLARAISHVTAPAPAAVPDEPLKPLDEPQVQVAPRDDDVILMGSDDEPELSAAPASPDIVMMSTGSGKVEAVDRSTGEVLAAAPTIERAEAASARAEAMSDDDLAKVLALADAAELMSSAADALPDDVLDDLDPMESQYPEPPVSHVPRAPSTEETGKAGFDPVAVAQKHFYPLAGVAAVIVFSIAFHVGRQHRDVPVVAPVVAPIVAPIPAPAQANVPASVPAPVVASAPVIPAPASVKPAAAPPVAPPAPAVLSPAPAAPAKPAAPAVSVPTPPAAQPVAKPEVHKPVKPVAREHVTTMHDTNQALDQLRSKLGE